MHFFFCKQMTNKTKVNRITRQSHVTNLDHKNGRPTKREQIYIERKLRPCFENSISARVTAGETGFNLKTVTKYFNQWKKEITESETPDFLKRCKEEKERCLISYEKQISSLLRDKKEVELLIDGSRRARDVLSLEKLYKLKLKNTEMIGKFLAARINLVNAATADTVFDLEQKEKKNGN